MLVVHERPAELVVVKPAGLVCEAPRDPAADTLIGRLGAGGFDDLRLPHRLDAPACGLVLVARTPAAAAHYAQAIESRRWLKVYVARVAAPVDVTAAMLGTHKAYLKVHGRQALVVRSGGKAAWLDLLDATPAPGAHGESHVLIRLRTGRFHQIRAMLAHLGAPLTGDARYGGPHGRPFVLEHTLLGAHLHGSGAWCVWSCPPHADRDPWEARLTARIEALRLDAERGDAPALGEIVGPGGQRPDAR